MCGWWMSVQLVRISQSVGYCRRWWKYREQYFYHIRYFRCKTSCNEEIVKFEFVFEIIFCWLTARWCVIAFLFVSFFYFIYVWEFLDVRLYVCNGMRRWSVVKKYRNVCVRLLQTSCVSGLTFQVFVFIHLWRDVVYVTKSEE